jgi:YgiT-type zinc finger domain-containing protein
MASSSEIEYGQCPCGGHFKSREVEVSMTVFGRAIVLPRVPQGVCPTCASRVYKAQVLECVESVMREWSVSHSC